MLRDDDFLADAALAGDQDLGVAARDAIDLGLQRVIICALLADQPDVLLVARAHSAGGGLTVLLNSRSRSLPRLASLIRKPFDDALILAAQRHERRADVESLHAAVACGASTRSTLTSAENGTPPKLKRNVPRVPASTGCEDSSRTPPS